MVRGTDYQNTRLLADAWCATFVWTKDDSELGRLCPTDRVFRGLQSSPDTLLPKVRSEIDRLRNQYQFFHWHLAFPDVFRLSEETESHDNEQLGSNTGFDVMLGNPPWEQMEVSEQEWFAQRLIEVADSKNAFDRKRKIEELRKSNSEIFADFKDTQRKAAAARHFIRESGRFPLTARGRFNTYALFTELSSSIQSDYGSTGIIVPSGIILDDTYSPFFKNQMKRNVIRSVFSFYEIRRFFPGTDSRKPFCLFTSSGLDHDLPAAFAFDLRIVSDVSDSSKYVYLDCAGNRGTAAELIPADSGRWHGARTIFPKEVNWDGRGRM